MSPATDPSSPGYFPRLLSAAAFLTSRATEESLTELRLTHERSVILRLLADSPATEEQLCAYSGLAPECVHDCVVTLQHCGYVTSGTEGSWTITSSGKDVCAQADDAEAKLMFPAGSDVDGLRAELHSLIRALTPPADR